MKAYDCAVPKRRSNSACVSPATVRRLTIAGAHLCSVRLAVNTDQVNSAVPPYEFVVRGIIHSPTLVLTEAVVSAERHPALPPFWSVTQINHRFAHRWIPNA